MARRLIRDKTLFDLATKLELDYPLGPFSWEPHLQAKLSPELLEKLAAFQMALSTQENSDIESEFYNFTALDPVLARTITEGRLGYYDSILPKLRKILVSKPNTRILDLGLFGGILTLSLASMFPNSQVVGLEYCAAWVERALEFKQICKVENAEFKFADYNNFTDDTGFDVIISCMSMPITHLPEIPSESPTTHIRGFRLEEVLEEIWPNHVVAKSLSSLRRLCKNNGLIIIHERVQSLSQMLMMNRLAALAKIEINEILPLSFSIAAEGGENQEAPLLICSTNDIAEPLGEEALINLYFPKPHTVSIKDEEASLAYSFLPSERKEVCTYIFYSNDNQLNIYFGIAGNTIAYIYLASTKDFRELYLAPSHHAFDVFNSRLNELSFYWLTPDVKSTSHSIDELEDVLKELFLE